MLLKVVPKSEKGQFNFFFPSEDGSRFRFTAFFSKNVPTTAPFLFLYHSFLNIRILWTETCNLPVSLYDS
ncbi:hypothetical protein CH370_00760 [Leptospira kmetyi]|uniref:DUF1564 family protein n=1 Tax=Leptospira kmetyi TaxID=408139 RepID=A0ABX4N513_9LEPT|nr:hypothetical protein CH378_17605 [Leptospira kmetyi]PJZ43002.1 hypothetical protein CH370_00760 [Leptospira kmetyi]